MMQEMAQGESLAAHSEAALTLKRALDLSGAVVCLILLSPLLLAIALLVKLDSAGPVLYKRRLVGLKGQPFTAYKFRTMVSNAHDLLQQDPELLCQYQQTLKIAKDPRVTRLGRILRKTSLDELPQLFNVLRGEMSLVGPRMLGDIELERYGAYKEKVLSVKPGITGLWQVSGRHTVSFERRVELDLEYVEHWSPGLDLKILLLTIPAVLTRKGAE
jgi:lipopolysaccharide/colanic/teichoic acid biosynthesis glycosyltransferase